MRWSKLKQLVEARFADGVRGRVELRTTRYAKAHDQFGRSWITVDGQEVANMSNYLKCGDAVADGHPGRFEAGVFAGYDLPLAMRAYLTLSIDKAIASKNPLIRALAALVRRAGQRRLARFDAANSFRSSGNFLLCGEVFARLRASLWGSKGAVIERRDSGRRDGTAAVARSGGGGRGSAIL